MLSVHWLQVRLRVFSFKSAMYNRLAFAPAKYTAEGLLPVLNTIDPRFILSIARRTNEIFCSFGLSLPVSLSIIRFGPEAEDLDLFH